MIFANHAHIYPAELKEAGSIDNLKKLMYECEIDKAVAFSTFQKYFTDAGWEQNSNDWLYEHIKDDPSLVGFGTVDFTKGNLKDQVEHIYQLGFKGIKIHPAFQKIELIGKEAFEVYAAAEERRLFLSFHSGLHWHNLRKSLVLDHDEIAWNFPNLRFSMEHVGGYSFFRDALAVIVNNKRSPFPQVFAGITNNGMGENGVPGAWSLTDLELCTLIAQTGERNTIFGLDFPFCSAEYIKGQIQRIRNLDISETAKENILYNNLQNALFGEENK